MLVTPSWLTGLQQFRDHPIISFAGNQIRIVGEIARLASAGVGIVLSTHNPDHAFTVATQITVMRAGRLYASGKPEVVMTAETLTELYGVPIKMLKNILGPPICEPEYQHL